MVPSRDLSQRYFNDVYAPMNFGPRGPIRRFCSRFFRTTAPTIAAHCVSLLRYTPPTTLLDLGCGPGTFLADLAAVYPLNRAVGVDFSAASIAMAEARLPNRDIFSFEHGPIDSCHALRETYDAVLAIGLFDYLPLNARLLAAMLNAAKKTVILTLPRRRLRLQRLARRAWLRLNGIELRTYSNEELKSIQHSVPEARQFSIYSAHPPDLPDNEWFIAHRR